MCVTAKQLTLNFLSYRDDILLVDDSSTKGGKIFGFVNFCLPRVIVVTVFWFKPIVKLRRNYMLTLATFVSEQ